jgi:toxin ParE1/3/4
MSWRVVVRPEVEEDMAEAAAWYDTRQPGLGAEFREEVIQVFDALTDNPL